MLDSQFSQAQALDREARNLGGIDFDGLINYIRNEPAKMPCVAEVMSPPRVVTEAVKLGCKDGGSFDLKNGWNFLDPYEQDLCLANMERDGVDVVVVTPP